MKRGHIATVMNAMLGGAPGFGMGHLCMLCASILCCCENSFEFDKRVRGYTPCDGQ